MGRETETKKSDRIRVEVGLEGAYRGFGFRAGMGAEVVRHDGDLPPQHAPDGPEIIPCRASRPGSKSLLPRRSGDTATRRRRP